MMVEHVSFSALKFVLDAPTKASFVLFANPNEETASVDVTSAVQKQLAEREDGPGEVQFRFAFEQAAHLNGKSDDVHLNPVNLEVSYLVP
jgi:hypothetical protein